MISQLDLNRHMTKEERKERMTHLIPQLGILQRHLRDAAVPVMVVFEGYAASGKGYQIGRLLKALDPRGFAVETIGAETQDEAVHPYFWRFWSKTPANGQIAIFDRSWYRWVTDGTSLSEAERLLRYQEINAFEKTLVDSGTLIIKLMLCISKKEQKERLDALEENADTAWRVTKADRFQNRHFKRTTQMLETAVELTDTDTAPWHLIEADDKDFASVKIYQVVIDAISARLKAGDPDPGSEYHESYESTAPEPSASIAHAASAEDTAHTEQSSVLTQSGLDKSFVHPSILSQVDLSLSLPEDQYEQELSKLQDRIEMLHHLIYRNQIPVVIGFEGWDAGGKGGAIKRLTEKMDPRGFRVNPTAAPAGEEKEHHYLWRFWKHMPKDGHIAIFDRTWYGRVMVERIEGFCSAADWKRAYQEINEMERELVRHGAVVLKFWMQISKDEQERRFNERMNDPLKRWKITDEDWRNRSKWDQYVQAVDEMLLRTSVPNAPWVIVEGNDKYYARIKVLRTVVHALEERLRKEGAL